MQATFIDWPDSALFTGKRRGDESREYYLDMNTNTVSVDDATEWIGMTSIGDCYTIHGELLLHFVCCYCCCCSGLAFGSAFVSIILGQVFRILEVGWHCNYNIITGLRRE